MKTTAAVLFAVAVVIAYVPAVLTGAISWSM
jgi:hypothetical protein